jgi:hypothetical protein
MSSFITTAFVQQYSANIYMLAQQKGSRLRPYVRQESQRGVTAYYDQIGAVNAVKKVNRGGDTPILDTPYARRAVTMNDYEWADLIDEQDKIRTLIDPQNAYAQAAMWAMGRSMDDEIIAAALGNAKTGVDGSTIVALPASQYVGAVVTQPNPYNGTAPTPAVSNLNVETLIRVKSKFGVADTDEDEPVHMAVTQSEIDALLNQTQVTSADYASVKALAQGTVDSFMGIQFHRLQRLPTAGSGGFVATISLSAPYGTVTLSSGNGNNCRRCFAWKPSGLLLAIGEDMVGKIDPRPDKSYSTQVYARMSIGATRMEEVKVVAVLCTES